jgi:GT2 family glycosyltransferase
MSNDAATDLVRSPADRPSDLDLRDCYLVPMAGDEPAAEPGPAPGTVAAAGPGLPPGQPPGGPAVPWVLAVLLVRDGQDVLPRSLGALATQRRAPDAVVLVDAGEHAVPGLLDRARAVLDVPVTSVRLPTGSGISAAVVGALTATATEASDRAWLWLLHDDSAADPEALSGLLAAVETAPSVVVAGCKQTSWDDAGRLLDVGLATTRLGAVVTGVDHGELDQGQQDGRVDVLAVAEPGMLVRSDIWRLLGGPAAGLSGTRAAIDVCRRARLAGHRVIVVPDAAVAHAPARRQGNPRCAGGFELERHEALLLRLAAVAGPLLLPALLWSVAAAPARAAGWLVLKRPARAMAELRALAGVALRPDRWLRARQRDRQQRRVPRRVLRALRPDPRTLWRRRRDGLAAWVIPVPEPRGPAAAAGAPESEATPGRVTGRAWTAPLPVLAVVTAAAVAAGWRLLGTGALLRDGFDGLVGPYLPPVPTSATQLWQLAHASWRPVGLGHPGIADPFDTVLAVLSWPLGGDPSRTVTLLLLLGPVLAAGSAWLAVALSWRSWWLRCWAALTWAAWPSLWSAGQTGRPAAVLAHVVLPLAAAALARAVLRAGLAAAAAAGLALTVLLAAAPALTLAVVVVLLAVTVLTPLLAPAGQAGRERSGRWRAVLPAVAGLIPAGLLLPWWLAVARTPGLLLADPATGWTGAVDAGAGGPAWAAGWPLQAGWEVLQRSGNDLAVGTGHAPGAVALVVIGVVLAPLVVLAVAALLRRRAAGAGVLLGWVTVLAAIATATAGQRSVVGSGRSWPGPGLSLAGLGLLLAALLLAPVIRRRLLASRVGLRHGAGLLLAAGCALGPLLALAAGTWQGLASPAGGYGSVTHRAAGSALPSLAVAEAEGSVGSRTLVLAGDGRTLRWNLARTAAPWLGTGSTVVDARPPARGGPDSAVVLPVVAGLLSDPGLDSRPALTQLGVGSVLLTAPVDDALAQALDVAPGLVRVGGTGAAALWRVDPAPGGAPIRPGRARIVNASGATASAVSVLPTGAGDGFGDEAIDTPVPGGRAGRLLVLADRSDPGWTATLDGRALPVARRGWAQAWQLPVAGGRLRVAHSAGWVARTGPLRIGLAVLAALIAVPLPRLRRRVAAPAPPRRSLPVNRLPAPLRPMPPVPQIYDAEHPADGDVVPVLSDPVSAEVTG